MLIRHQVLESFGYLPYESCDNIVSFNFYLIIVSSAWNFDLVYFSKKSGF